MDEYEFLQKMFRRLNEMQRCYPPEDGIRSAADIAIEYAIRDYLNLRKELRHDR